MATDGKLKLLKRYEPAAYAFAEVVSTTHGRNLFDALTEALARENHAFGHLEEVRRKHPTRAQERAYGEYYAAQGRQFALRQCMFDLVAAAMGVNRNSFKYMGELDIVKQIVNTELDYCMEARA